MEALERVSPQLDRRLKRGGLAVLAAGAVALTASLVAHPRVTTRQITMPISPVKPFRIVVVVAGTSNAPGIVGFLATIRPKAGVVQLIPLRGSTRVRIPNGAGGFLAVPVWRATGLSSRPIVASAIAQATGFHATRYFFMPADGLRTIIKTLAADASNWPAADTPNRALALLGYPRGTVHPVREIRLLDQIMLSLPQITPLEASSLVGVALSSGTNLTQYQLFTLGNFVRGDSLEMATSGSLRPHRHPLGRHPHRPVGVPMP